MAGPLGLLGAALIAVSDSSALVRFAFVRSDVFRYALAAAVMTVTFRIGRVGWLWWRGRRPLVEVTSSGVTLHTVFNTVSWPFSELVEVTLLPDGRGLRLVGHGQVRTLGLQLENASWDEVFARVQAAWSER